MENWLTWLGGNELNLEVVQFNEGISKAPYNQSVVNFGTIGFSRPNH